MQAILGFYDNGVLTLDSKAPVSKSRVIVVFTEEVPRVRMSTSEALRIFYKYAGSIKGEVDYENERDAYLSEKYGASN